MLFSLATLAVFAVVAVAPPAAAGPSDNYHTGIGSNGVPFVGGYPTGGYCLSPTQFYAFNNTTTYPVADCDSLLWADEWSLTGDLWTGIRLDACGDGCNTTVGTWDRTTNTTVPAPASPSPSSSPSGSASPSPSATPSGSPSPGPSGVALSVEAEQALSVGVPLVVFLLAALLVSSWAGGLRG